MAATKPCRVCGSHPMNIDTLWECSNKQCKVMGPNDDEDGEKWDRLMDETIARIDSLADLILGMRKARSKHPWINQDRELLALMAEVRELDAAMRDGSVADIRAEALDCAVVAMRIVEGK